MAHRWKVWGLGFALSTLVSTPAIGDPVSIPPTIRGTLDGNNVYTCGVNGRSGVHCVTGKGVLSILRDDILGDTKLTIYEHPFSFYGNSIAMPRWQLIDKQYYSIHYSFAGDDLTGGFNSITLRVIEALKASGRHDDYRMNGDFSMNSGPHLDPIGWAFAGQEEPIKRRIFFDFWARGDNRYELYYTEPHLGKRLTRMDFHPERKVRASAKNVVTSEETDLQWEKVGEWEFDWTGPFYVVAIGDDRYFVTDSGRVFFAPRIDRKFAPEVRDFRPRRAVKPEMPLKEIWKGPPVDALIHDSDAKKWYAFTKNQYFEIADPIKPKPHTVAFRREWTATEALETAVLCGRVIRGLSAPPMNERTWDGLNSLTPRVGHEAVWAMSTEPVRAVALLKERLKPVAAPPAKELAALIDDLGADVFPKREAAQKRLRDFGQTIEPTLREAAATAAHPERKKRLNQLLTECQSTAGRTPDEIRAVRAVQVLKRIDTSEARRLLEAWGKGADAAVLTREARKALQP